MKEYRCRALPPEPEHLFVLVIAVAFLAYLGQIFDQPQLSFSAQLHNLAVDCHAGNADDLADGCLAVA